MSETKLDAEKVVVGWDGRRRNIDGGRNLVDQTVVV